MAKFEVKSVCILGRLPKLGLAELESLFGAEHIQPLDGAALLDIPAEKISFRRLGGTIKVARILGTLPYTGWPRLAKYLSENIPKHLRDMPDGKFTLGLSVYGISVSTNDINRAALQIKKAVRPSGRPVRVVPNKAPALNSAQVLHNQLTRQGAWELLLIKNGRETILAQTLFVQDIEAYAARDQARPARDARVGMLPPKLAQIIINLAAGNPESGELRMENREEFHNSQFTIHNSKILVLDPFCGSGVILQEALLMGFSVFGTDIEPRMVEASRRNLRWLVEKFPNLEASVTIETADATHYQWPGFSLVASETFLGRPLNSLPDEAVLKQIVSDVNVIIKKFLKNLAPQLKPGRSVCLAVPAWRRPNGQLIRLPLIDQLTDMGYNYSDLKHVRREDLIYFREDQVVARQLLRLSKA